jgi:hypothetical protein
MNPAGRPGSMNLPLHAVGSNKQKNPALSSYHLADQCHARPNNEQQYLNISHPTFSDSPRLPFRHRIGPVSRSLNLIAQIQAVDSFPLY